MNTGGPAFPTPEIGVDLFNDEGREIGCRVFPPSQGMTLLDWMAGQSLANRNIEEHSGKGWPDRVALQAYTIAEAMLAEKARREEATRSAFEQPGVATAMAVHEAFSKDNSPNAGKMAKLEALNRELVKALKALLARDQRNTCQHEETHRGGALWEICDQCNVSWADDRGGKPPWSDPPEWIAAEAAITKCKEVA